MQCASAAPVSSTSTSLKCLINRCGWIVILQRMMAGVCSTAITITWVHEINLLVNNIGNNLNLESQVTSDERKQPLQIISQLEYWILKIEIKHLQKVLPICFTYSHVQGGGWTSCTTKTLVSRKISNSVLKIFWVLHTATDTANPAFGLFTLQYIIWNSISPYHSCLWNFKWKVMTRYSILSNTLFWTNCFQSSRKT